MATKSLIESGTGRTTRLIVRCVADALANPNQKVMVYDHDNKIKQGMVEEVSFILNRLDVRHLWDLDESSITVLPIPPKAVPSSLVPEVKE